MPGTPSRIKSLSGHGRTGSMRVGFWGSGLKAVGSGPGRALAAGDTSPFDRKRRPARAIAQERQKRSIVPPPSAADDGARLRAVAQIADLLPHVRSRGGARVRPRRPRVPPRVLPPVGATP